jgi:signal transduction histidine kinase
LTVDAPVTAPAAPAAQPLLVERATRRGWTPDVFLFPLVVAVALYTIVARPAGGLSPVTLTTMVLALAFAVAGVVLITAGSHLLGRLVSLGALAGSLAVAAAHRPNHGHGAALAVTCLGAAAAAALGVHALLGLPDGLLRSRARRLATVFTYATAGVLGALASARVLHVAPGAAAGLWTAGVLLTVPAVTRRYPTASAFGRGRLQWLAAGALVAAEIAMAAGVLHLLVDWPADLAAVAVAALVALPLSLLPGARPSTAVGGDRVVMKLVPLVAFTVVVSAIYAVVLLGAGRLPSGGHDREVLALSMVAAALAALAYAPLRTRVTATATRIVYGTREAPDEVLRTFGSRLTRAIPMDELLLQLCESLTKSLQLSNARVFTGSGDVLELAASVPDTPSKPIVITPRERPVITRAGVSGRAWVSIWIPALLEDRGDAQLRVAPVCHAGELLGLIAVERPADADAFSEDHDQVLSDLARQVGLAFHNAQLDSALQTSLDELRKQADELRASRARIVASGDAERRRVERNLHDGAQQHLVALAVNLRLTRDMVADDPEAAVEMLEELGAAVQETIQELRELAHGIYPPLLVDGGLPDALRAVAARSPLDVRLETAGIGRYDRDVEAAVYFCVLEALQNAGKHAPGARVEITVEEQSGGLLFSVVDDGPGFDVAVATRGHGYTNMADRLGAIGGSIRWESEPGRGTAIRGSVPLE